MPGFIDETPDAFVVELPDGKTTQIAKAALSPDTVASYRSQLQPKSPASLPPLGITPNMGLAPPMPMGMTPVAPPSVEETKKPLPTAAPPTPAFAAGPSGGPLGAAQQAATASLETRMPVAPSSAAGVSGAGLDAAARKQMSAEQKATDAARSQVRAEAAAADEVAKVHQEQIAKAQASEERRQAAVAEGEKTYKAAYDALKTPDGKVDPGRFWGSRSTGQKVLAGIAVALSGFGNGLMGRGGNDALSLIQKQIDDDIDAQKANIAGERERKRDTLQGASTMLGQLRAKFGDERAAESAFRAMALEQAQATVQSKLALSKDPAIVANGEKLVADLGMKLAEKKAELAHWNADFALKQEQLGLQRYEAGMKAAQAQGIDPELYVPGYGMALGKDAAKEARGIVSAHNETSSLLNDLIAMRKEFGGETLNREAVAKMRTLSTQLIGALNRSQRFGALDKGTQSLLENMTGGDPTAYGTKSLAALMQIRSSMDKDIEGKLSPYLNPGRREKSVQSYENRMTAK